MVSLLGRLSRLAKRLTARRPNGAARRERPEQRRCRFETMEPRQMLDADPLLLGAVYYEADGGSDSTPDVFEIAFDGGSPTTELTDLSLQTNPITYFDTADGGDGVPLHFDFELDAARSVGITSEDILDVRVVDGGTTLDLSIADFRAGDKLVFTIDVDHAVGLSDDPIASGAEFELSTLHAAFFDPNFAVDPAQPELDVRDPIVRANLDGTEQGIFWNAYDPNFAQAGLDDTLPADNFLNHHGQGQADRTAGAVLGYDLTPLPITLSGTVFHDRNLDLAEGPGDAGIASVQLQLLFKQQENGTYEPVRDENGQPVTTTTDANGDYAFGIDDNLVLYPGYYQLVETQPADFAISVGAIPGTVVPGDGQPVGQLDAADPTNIIRDIYVPFGNRDAVSYDFAEANPIQISGNVHLSGPNGECFGPGHPDHRPIEGARVYLVSDLGDIYLTETGPDGNYTFAAPEFPDLLPGTYTLIEVTPAGLFDGGQSVGTVDGVENGVVDTLTEIQLQDGGVLLVSDIVEADELGRLDFITQVELLSGDQGVQYNFCEHEPSSISGYVYGDLDDDGLREAGEGPVLQPGSGGSLQPVQVLLLDQNGNPVGSTWTDDQGFYIFENLMPGSYTVQQLQPDGYFDGKDAVGTIQVDGVDTAVGLVLTAPDAGGVLRDNDQITSIDLGYGQHGVDYNFGEIPPSSLSGFVYHDANNDGVFDPAETPLSGVEVELRLTFSNPQSGLLLTADHLLDPSVLNSEGRYIVTTGADGSYEFTGLRGGAIPLDGGTVLPGNYTVYELTQPSDFDDGLDSPGSTSGLADNSNHEGQPPNTLVAQAIIDVHTASGARSGDLVFQVPLGIAQASVNNNFGEVMPPPPPPPPPPPSPPPEPPASLPVPSSPPLFILPPPLRPPVQLSPPVVAPVQAGVAAAPAILVIPEVAAAWRGAGPRGGGGQAFTWHLSVLNGGNPRGQPITVAGGTIWRAASHLDRTQWGPEHLRDGQWTLPAPSDEAGGQAQVRHIMFGIDGAIPIAGDFNGDGVDEVGVYYQGEWFLDLSGNGQWDENDLWAKLGGPADRPVTGDWDGDGKVDIGVFGPEWPRDPIAIEQEPGLPDPDNLGQSTPKNLPPGLERATSGERLIRLTSKGTVRADVIDHVFRYGLASDLPVSGDWNGDGISSIGLFRDGRWNLDVDGNGRLSRADIIAQFGRTGDIPVVGDFNGDGVDEIGVYRGGQWLIDTNGNHELDATDKIFQMGGADDLPIVGDWNGDGIDEPGLYRNLRRDAA